MHRLIVSALLLSTSIAGAQERTFTVTLPETQWNTVGKIMSKALAPWEDTNPIMQQITSQIGQGLQQDAQARQKGIEAEKKLDQTAAELAAMTKKQNDAIAEIERLKAELAKTPASPEPEKP